MVGGAGGGGQSENVSRVSALAQTPRPLTIAPQNPNLVGGEYIITESYSEHYADAVIKLASDPETAGAMGIAGRRAVERSWSMERYIDRHMSLMELQARITSG